MVLWDAHVNRDPLTMALNRTWVTGIISRWIAQLSLSQSHMACTQSISIASSGAIPLGIYRGRWTVLLKVKRLYRLYPVHQASCSLGNNLLCVWIMYSYVWFSHSELWILYQSKHALWFRSIWSQRYCPQINYSHIHFRKGSSRSWWYWCRKWNSSFRWHFLVSGNSLFSTSSTLTISLVTRGRRGTFCCPWKIFPIGVSFEVSGRSSDALESELSLASRFYLAFSFNFILLLQITKAKGWHIFPFSY